LATVLIVGKIYLEGNDVVSQNNETAFKYFKKAAALNNPVGQSGTNLVFISVFNLDLHKYSCDSLTSWASRV